MAPNSTVFMLRHCDVTNQSIKSEASKEMPDKKKSAFLAHISFHFRPLSNASPALKMGGAIPAAPYRHLKLLQQTALFDERLFDLLCKIARAENLTDCVRPSFNEGRLLTILLHTSVINFFWSKPGFGDSE